MRSGALGGSFWDGRSRTGLRAGLAVIVVSNLVGAASDVWQDQRGPWSHPLAPDWLLNLGGSPLVAVLLVAGTAAMVQFARKPGQLAAGALALAAMALLVEADGALNEGPKRHFFAPGLALLGWLAGLAFARLLARHSGRTRAELVAWQEIHAEMGAVAALAGNYVDAVASKLWHVGPGWANDTTLRAVILAHHPLGDGSLAGQYAHAVAGSAVASQVLSIATLFVQGGACLMLLGPRWRLAAGLAVFAFHCNVDLLAGIGYGPARTLLLLFCLPWPQVLPRVLHRWPRAVALFAVAPPLTTPVISRTTLVRAGALALALVGATVLIARSLPIRSYTALHHSYTGDRAGPRAQHPQP